jgi:hypothetical protein
MCSSSNPFESSSLFSVALANCLLLFLATLSTALAHLLSTALHLRRSPYHDTRERT